MGPQTSIAHYRIIAKLGEGGMGIVYRATDTKLNRDVAIKVLPDSVAEDSDRLARFSREAQVLASLNHPNIAAIYGVEDRALIMELVEGPTLEQRLAQGAIRIADALPIACQIAEALEYAHDRGVIHRDLKPANVKVTPEGRVKVLDFGLAKALATESAAIDPASSPTMTMRATMAGVIMGTAAYMSPEQAKGKPVDRRTDIWAFGVLFAEMLSGRMMYSAETVSETLAAVLLKEPDLSTIPAGTPSAVRRTLRRCLEKDVTRRLQAIGEARIAIDEPEDTALQLPAPVAPVRRGAPWWALGAVSIVALAMPVLWWRASRPVEHPLQRFVVDFGPNSQAGTSTSLAISRDGTRIVYSVNPGDAPVVSAAAALSQRMLATRRLDQSQGTVLAGTEDASNPFFSPDGRWIAFFASRKLKKVSVDGGAPAVLCDAPNQRGGDWGEDGYIVAAFSSTGGLMRVPSSGGTPEPFSKLNDGEEKTHRYPQILPGGAVLVTSSKDPNLFDTANAAVVPAHGGAAKVVQRQGTFAHYLPSGHLVFIRDETLFGVAFDLNRSETRGTPVPLLDGLTPNLTSGGGQFSFSHSGTFAFLESRFSNQASPLVSLSATGTEEPLTPPLGPRPFSPEYSPDGKRIALTAGKSIVVYDLERRGQTLVTPESQTAARSRWAPDGKHLFFSSGSALQYVRADGSATPQTLLAGGDATPSSISPDGRYLIYHQAGEGSDRDLWVLPLDLSDPDRPKPGTPEVFAASPRIDVEAAFSPDGRWVAYVTLNNPASDVWVRPFPSRPEAGQLQVSTGPARFPVWSTAEKVLYYVSGSRIMAVPYSIAGRQIQFEKPREWSRRSLYLMGNAQPYALAPDGKHFAIFAPVAEKATLHLTFLLNFFDEVKRRIPTGN